MILIMIFQKYSKYVEGFLKHFIPDTIDHNWNDIGLIFLIFYKNEILD